MWVSYTFRVALDHSSLIRSIYFWCYDTTLKNIVSIEKLNLTWNKLTNFVIFLSYFSPLIILREFHDYCYYQLKYPGSFWYMKLSFCKGRRNNRDFQDFCYCEPCLLCLLDYFALLNIGGNFKNAESFIYLV